MRSKYSYAWASSVVRELLEVVRAAERVDRVHDPGLVRDHLLRAQREPHRVLGRERERLVERVRVQALGSPEHGRERLECRTHDVHLGLLRGQRDPCRLRVEAHEQRALATRAEAVAELARPDPAGGAVLGDLLEEVEMRVEEEGEPGREIVDREAALYCCLDVGEAVGERERELLGRIRACLADVVPRDRDRMEERHLARAELDHVHDEPHGRLGRVDPFLLRDVFLEDVGLRGAAQPLARDALLLPDADVVREEDRRGRVDRHRGRDLAERDTREERLRVGQRVDCHALAPDLAERALMVRVVAHERRHVEGCREPRLAVLQEVVEALVRLLGGAEARELPHRPEAAAVHRRIHPARERELARIAEVTPVVEFDVRRGVERLRLRPPRSSRRARRCALARSRTSPRARPGSSRTPRGPRSWPSAAL